MRRLMVAGMVAVSGALASTVVVGGTPVGSPVAAAADAPTTPALLPPLRGWQPRLGPIFNEPGRKGSTAIVARVLQAIRHTPRGETIRLATYSFDRGEIAAALRKARKRGVRVQVVVNQHTASGLVYSLQRSLGKNPAHRNFVVTCPGRCRAAGDGGNQHMKVFAFTRTGGARDVLIGSSGNLTSKAVERQWNDSWAIGYDPKVFDTWVGFFQQMAAQKRRGSRVVQVHQSHVPDPYSMWLQRTGVHTLAAPVARTAAQDPVVQRIRAVGCRRAQAGYGTADGRTVVRIMEYALYGGRGVWVADAIAGLKRAGCDVMVVGSVFSKQVQGILQRAGVPLRMADWSFAERLPEEEDGLSGWGPRFYAHYKAMIVSGAYDRHQTKSVWTGSENWSGISFANEEVVVRFTNAGYYRAYAKQFDKLWSGRATHRAGLEPTYGPPR